MEAIPSHLQLCAGAFNAVSAGLIVLDQSERIVLWNDWMSSFSGLARQACAGRTLGELFPELQDGRLSAAVTTALRRGYPSLLSHSLNKSPLPLFCPNTLTKRKQRIQQAIQVMPLQVGELPRHCLIQVSDISLSVARERLLRDQAMELRTYSHIDSLTGVPNRRHFDEYISSELRRSVRASLPLSLIMLDLDYFKAYNDTYGHQMGDQCLIQVAAALESSLNRPGDMVARLGGEEFVVVLADTDKEGAAVLAERLRAKIESLAIEHRNSKVATHVTASLGVTSEVPGQACESAMLVAAADRALYRAKHDGRNCVRLDDPELVCGTRQGS